MGKIIACIDGSAYADHVCALAAWAHGRMGLDISLLHVLAPHWQAEAKADVTGQIGLGAKSSLLEELTKIDEEHGKLEQKKGQLILSHAKGVLAAKGIPSPEVIYRRGSLIQTLTDLEAQANLIVIGKRGLTHQNTPDHLGSNLEDVARTIHTPLLVASADIKPVQNYLIAYDGSPSADKVADFIARSPLLRGAQCHVLNVGQDTPQAHEVVSKVRTMLAAAGARVQVAIRQGKSVEDVVAQYIKTHDIDLLAIGAYGHSKIRTLILGSTTTALIGTCAVPVLLLR